MNRFDCRALPFTALLLCACAGAAKIPEQPTPVEPVAANAEQPEVANPASTHCESNNGTLEIQSDEKGQFG
ncbi:MAG: DUF333 domain-containing protein, partial [Nannocystaceae bacterium]